MKKKLRLGIFVIGCCILIGNFSCTQQEKNSTANKNIEINGGNVYNRYCVSCHGKDGKMGISGAKDLSISLLSHQEKIIVISNGRGGMMPYKDLLSKEEIEAVSEFIKKLKK